VYHLLLLHCSTHQSKALIGHDAMLPLSTFVTQLSHTDTVNTSPAAISIDAILTVLDSDHSLPSLVLRSISVLETTAADTTSQDFGISAVFCNVTQGKQLLKAVKAKADSRSQEMGYLNDIVAIMYKIDGLPAWKSWGHSDPAVASWMSAITDTCAAVGKAVIKANSEAAKNYLDSVRDRITKKLEAILRSHLIDEVLPWMKNVWVTYTTTSSYCSPPAWTTSPLKKLVDSRLTHSVDLGALPFVIGLHAELNNAATMINQAATGKLDTVSLVTSSQQFSTFILNGGSLFSLAHGLAKEMEQVGDVLTGLKKVRKGRTIKHKSSCRPPRQGMGCGKHTHTHSQTYSVIALLTEPLFANEWVTLSCVIPVCWT
jgi:hypothetical protein